MSQPIHISEDDLHLLRIRMSNNDERAFEKLFHIFYLPLLSFAGSFVKKKEIAAEVVDDVFVRLWNNRSQLNTINNLKVYLYKATKNTVLNYISRDIFNQIHEPFDHIDIELREERDPENMMISRQTLDLIKKAIDALPPRCKMIFKLIREDGLSYAEVAEVLNISIKTVDAQMVIAVSKIKSLLHQSAKTDKRNFYLS
jgi:RNA polymerase sigma-70 factor (ECF subfamily)